MSGMTITPVAGKRDLKAFMDLAYRLNAKDPNWIPPLRGEVRELFDPARNPFFDHATVQFFLARQDGRVTGRISAHIDHMALAQPPEQGMGPGTGNWGLLEAEDEATATALMSKAESWLKDQGMTRVLAPISMSVWEEPGLLVRGHDHPPMVMMGHAPPHYQGWIEGAGYMTAKRLFTYDLDVTKPFPPLVQRIVQSGERSDRIRIREVDLARYHHDAAIILHILNDAWSGNWGFVPFTDREITHTAKKLRPLVHGDLIRIAEYDGEPVAFMMTLPDVNQVIHRIRGKLLPFGWAKLLWWLRKPADAQMRVPLMGVLQKLQSSRLASQLAFMMIEYIRRDAIVNYGSKRAEIGWILEDNQGMVAIADAIGSKINKEYRIYQKAL